MAQFELGVTLGTGAFGRVRSVTHKSTGTHWALKMLKKAEVIRLQQVSRFAAKGRSPPLLPVWRSHGLNTRPWYPDRSSTCSRRSPFWRVWTTRSS